MYALWRRFLLQYARLCNDQYAVPLSDADVEKDGPQREQVHLAEPVLRPVGRPGAA